MNDNDVKIVQMLCAFGSLVTTLVVGPIVAYYIRKMQQTQSKLAEKTEKVRTDLLMQTQMVNVAAQQVKEALDTHNSSSIERIASIQTTLAAQDKVLEKVIVQTNGLLDKVAEKSEQAGYDRAKAELSTDVTVKPK